MDQCYTRIDLGAIGRNVERIKALVAPAKMMAVVKADGYNHGAVEVARTALAHGADQLGVATVPEALALRRSGITAPILAWIWLPTNTDLLREAIDQGIRLGVSSVEHARVAAELGATVDIKVDTGLLRGGVREEHWAEVFALFPPEKINGLFSHLASGEQMDNPSNDEQRAVFERAIALYESAGGVGRDYHFSNSPATLIYPELRYAMVRPGIAVYGLSPVPDCPIDLEPAMSLCGRVAVVKKIKAGERVSYNHTWEAPTDGFTAVIPVGYADGLPRAVQGHLEVSINGKRYPQVGRVCMDQFVVFLGDDDSVAVGDEAFVFGGPGMSATELADAIGTINYEIVCMPHGRVVRHYINPESEAQ
ncbi:MAG: alanine racemase [Corynebacterium sp.]|nr:alanine racemase [Corynebacterium sp.]